jgi:hypothetical protein
MTEDFENAHSDSGWPQQVCAVCQKKFKSSPIQGCCSGACAGRQTIEENRIRAIAPDSPPWLRTLYSRVYYQARKGAKVRNRKQGIPFKLTETEFNKLVRRCGHRCEVTGRSFEDSPNTAIHHRQPFRPSLDRINSDGAYEYKNCRLVSVSANLGLGTWGDDIYRRNAFALVALTHNVVPKSKAELAADHEQRLQSTRKIDAPVHLDMDMRKLGVTPEQQRVAIARGSYKRGWLECAEKLNQEFSVLPVKLAPCLVREPPCAGEELLFFGTAAGFSGGWRDCADHHSEALERLEATWRLPKALRSVTFKTRCARLLKKILEGASLPDASC